MMPYPVRQSLLLLLCCHAAIQTHIIAKAAIEPDRLAGVPEYGFRYYGPGDGRWVSRDPIGEGGSPNLYAILRNQPTVLVDYLGQKAFTDSLTRAEAIELHCILKAYLGSSIVRLGGMLAGYYWTPKMVRRYVEQWGDTAMPYNAIRGDPLTERMNRDAEAAIFGKGITAYDPPYPQYFRSSVDLTNSLHGVLTHFVRSSPTQIHASIDKLYSFDPTKKKGGGLGGFTARFDFLTEYQARRTSCKWCYGDTISDRWMDDLRVFGLASEFHIRLEWWLSNEPIPRMIPLGY